MSMKISKKYNAEAIAAYILGFSTSVYVINFGNIGYTTVRLDIIISIILFFTLIFKKNSITNIVKYFNNHILIFSVIVVISGLNVIYYSTTIGHGDRFLKTLIIYIVCLMTYSCVLLLKDKKQYIIKGLLMGLIVNILLSFIQYFSFEIGSYFTLYSIFPQSSFYIPIYNFRTQGFFLEPSHMMQFFISTFFLFLIVYKNNWRKKVILIFLMLIVF